MRPVRGALCLSGDQSVNMLAVIQCMPASAAHYLTRRPEFAFQAPYGVFAGQSGHHIDILL
jgi:hypothetical protein